MKGKKLWITLIAMILMTFTLVACGGNNTAEENESTTNDNATTEGEEQSNEKAEEPTIVAGAAMQDGTYRLEEQDFDDNGWKVFLEMTVEDGKIVSSDFDYVNEEGTLKTEDEEYQNMMAESSGVGPQEFTEQLTESLIATQNALEVDIVSGATGSSASFINYAQQLIQAAQKGDTETIVIPNQAPLQDGEYSLEEKNIGSTGWRFVMDMTVTDGEIVASNYNYVNADGDLKTDDDEYQELMTEKVGIGPQDFVPQLNDALVKTQDPTQVEVISGATHSAEVFKVYAAQLINAAQKGDTTKIEIDNFVYEN